MNPSDATLILDASQKATRTRYAPLTTKTEDAEKGAPLPSLPSHGSLIAVTEGAATSSGRRRPNSIIRMPATTNVDAPHRNRSESATSPRCYHASSNASMLALAVGGWSR